MSGADPVEAETRHGGSAGSAGADEAEHARR